MLFVVCPFVILPNTGRVKVCNPCKPNCYCLYRDGDLANTAIIVSLSRTDVGKPRLEQDKADLSAGC